MSSIRSPMRRWLVPIALILGTFGLPAGGASQSASIGAGATIGPPPADATATITAVDLVFSEDGISARQALAGWDVRFLDADSHPWWSERFPTARPGGTASVTPRRRLVVVSLTDA